MPTLQTPKPTPYLSPQQGGNPYVPPGTVSYPISQNAIPVATARSGGTIWAGNTYGYSTTPYNIPSSQVRAVDAVNPQLNQTTQPTGNSGGTPQPQPQPNPNGPQYGWGREFSNMDEYNRFRDEYTNTINSGFDQYISQLNSILNEGLPQQRQSLIGQAQSSYDTNVSDVNTQKALELQGLMKARTETDASQSRSLKDLADDLRNAFQAGQVFLGSRGAGDSSAANQLSFALQQMGNRNRGDIIQQSRTIHNDINDREYRLNLITNNELNRLKEELNQQINGINEWFANQQNQIRQMIGQVGPQRAQALAALSLQNLQMAQQQAAELQSRYENRRDALLSWAMSNAQNINQLKANMSQLGQGIGSINPMEFSPSFQAGPQGDIVAQFGGGREEERRPRTLADLGQFLMVR